MVNYPKNNTENDLFFEVPECQCFDYLKKGMIFKIDCTDPNVPTYHLITFKNKKYMIANSIIKVGNENYYQLNVCGFKYFKNNSRILSYVNQDILEDKNQEFLKSVFFDKFGKTGWKLCNH